MSRMSAWNRPSKHAAIPPPYYITSGDDTPYCHTCGRVMNSRKTAKNGTKSDSNAKSPVKYCSERCRKRKPGQLDRETEQAFLTLLNGGADTSTNEGKPRNKTKKGDSRILVKMDDVEELMFGKQPESEKKRVGKRNVLDPEAWRSVDMESSGSEHDSEPDDQDSGGAVLASSVGADEEMVELRTRKLPSSKVLDPTAEAIEHIKTPQEEAEEAAMATKRDEGQRRVEHKEIVRRAARRGVVFGYLVNDQSDGHDGDSENRRKCEAVVNGLVVEPSFAKGNWGIRWRD